MLTQQAFGPHVDHDLFDTGGSNMLWPGTIVEARRVKQLFEPLLLWFSQYTSKLHVEPNSFDPAILVQQKTSESKVVQTFFEPARFNKRAGSKIFEPLFSCLAFVVPCLPVGNCLAPRVTCFCEATREVVHLCLTRRASISAPVQKMCDPLVFTNLS